MTPSSDPVAEAKTLCEGWAKDIRKVLPDCQVFLFGSVIHDEGDQFDPENSDIDLVVVFTDEPDALTRCERIRLLRTFKRDLELRLIPRLHRTICVEPGISVVVLTQYELQANVHKSGVRRFFDRNFFLDLTTGITDFGIPGAGTVAIPDENRHALELAQKIRNDYLGEAANLSGGLQAYNGFDPLPKPITRAAAQLRTEAAKEEWYDTRYGLELLFDALSEAQGSEYAKLFKEVSKRRGGRGQRKPLSPDDLLLLGELLHTLAATGNVSAVVTWQIRLSGFEPSPQKVADITGLLKRLAPEAEVTRLIYGSLIVELRSSRMSYDLFSLLKVRSALAAIFDVDEAQLSGVFDSATKNPFESEPLLERLKDYLSGWHPLRDANPYEHEVALGAYLNEYAVNQVDPHLVIADEVIRSGRHRLPYDFQVMKGAESQSETVGVELTHSSRMLERRLTGLLSLDEDVILVVITRSEGIEALQETARRLETQRSRVQLVPVIS